MISELREEHKQHPKEHWKLSPPRSYNAQTSPVILEDQTKHQSIKRKEQWLNIEDPRNTSLTLKPVCPSTFFAPCFMMWERSCRFPKFISFWFAIDFLNAGHSSIKPAKDGLVTKIKEEFELKFGTEGSEPDRQIGVFFLVSSTLSKLEASGFGGLWGSLWASFVFV